MLAASAPASPGVMGFSCGRSAFVSPASPRTTPMAPMPGTLDPSSICGGHSTFLSFSRGLKSGPSDSATSARAMASFSAAASALALSAACSFCRSSLCMSGGRGEDIPIRLTPPSPPYVTWSPPRGWLLGARLSSFFLAASAFFLAASAFFVADLILARLNMLIARTLP